MTTKILAMVDALGNLIDFKLMPGQRNDICGVAPLIEGKEFAALLADKAFDADWLLLELEERGSLAVIPPRRNRKEQRAYDIQKAASGGEFLLRFKEIQEDSDAFRED